MSDDTRNDNTPDSEKNQPSNLFGSIDSNYDPNPSQEERGVSVDDEAEEKPDQAKETPEPAAEATEPTQTIFDRKPASEAPSESEPEQAAAEPKEKEGAKPVNDSVFGGENSVFSIAKAAELRNLTASEPTIVGADANLVKYDPESKQIVPRSAESAAVLESLGDDADIKAAHGGSFIATPLKMGEDGRMTKNPAQKAVRLASDPEDRKSISMLKPETTEEKLMRSNAARKERSQTQDGKDDKNKLGHDVGGEKDPVKLTAGAALITTVTNGLKKFGELIAKLWNKFLEKTGQAFSAVNNGLQKLRSGKPGVSEDGTVQGHDAANDSGLDLDEINRHLRKMSQDPLTPNAEANASGSMGSKTLENRINDRNQQTLNQVSGQAEKAIQNHQESLRNGVGAIERGMHLNEVGQIPLHSQTDFETRAKRSTPEDKQQITQGLQSLVNGTKAYRDEVNNLLNGDQIESVKPAERQKIMNQLLQEGAKGASALPEQQQKVLEHASVQGQSVKAKMSEMFSNSQAILEGRISQDASAIAAQASQQTQQRQSQEVDNSESVAPQA